MAGIPKFNYIKFGENGMYTAIRQGNQVFIKGTDGSLRKTDVNTFMRCLQMALPQVKVPPPQPSSPKIISKAIFEPVGSIRELNPIKHSDDLLTRMVKVAHNQTAVLLDPLKNAKEGWKNDYINACAHWVA